MDRIHSRDCDCPVCLPEPAIGGSAIDRLLAAAAGLALAALIARGLSLLPL